VEDRRLRLKAWRAHRFLSQVGLAERSGVSERAIVRLEKPDAPAPRVSTVRKLAAGLGVEPADLYRLPKKGE
jgi:transcriptional regulator with XRE-family HTH domain